MVHEKKFPNKIADSDTIESVIPGGIKVIRGKDEFPMGEVESMIFADVRETDAFNPGSGGYITGYIEFHVGKKSYFIDSTTRLDNSIIFVKDFDNPELFQYSVWEGVHSIVQIYNKSKLIGSK